ncbi:MAG: hypothetical protein H0V14_12495 [Chitinophagaceae bacterium]|jgi:predicted site-specific integrase-resolvase|nr:hypothetical protein [Chitinophagaceae bacterium]
MDAITILKDETHNRKIIQVDLEQLSKDEELLEDLFDIIISETRKNDELISWEEAKKELM